MLRLGELVVIPRVGLTSLGGEDCVEIRHRSDSSDKQGEIVPLRVLVPFAREILARTHEEPTYRWGSDDVAQEGE